METNKKKTAVDILHSQMMELICNNELSDREKITMGHNLFYEAKQMEREQINSDFFNGYEYCRNREINEQDDDIDINYYEETYGKQ